MKTKIEWATDVWNPVTGCTKVSEGCRHCYAETIAKRFWGERKFTDVRCHPDRLDAPLHWKKPRMVFVNSMSDLFHPDVPFEFIDKVFSVMGWMEEHTFMILTKRPQRMAKYFSEIERAYVKPLPNVWLGVTVENKKAADERIPYLLKAHAAVRFVSVEPMLSEMDITGYLSSTYVIGNVTENTIYVPRLDWVICGGESGPGARPMHPDWARSLRDQCQSAGVPFFFKKWGEWRMFDEDVMVFPDRIEYISAKKHSFPDGSMTFRVGKNAAGRLLDGREWNEYPEVK